MALTAPLPPLLQKPAFAFSGCVERCRAQSKSKRTCERDCGLIAAKTAAGHASDLSFQKLAQLEAHAQLRRMEALGSRLGMPLSSFVPVCRSASLLNRSRHRVDSVLIGGQPVGRDWRYYSVVECEGRRRRRRGFCMLAKRGVNMHQTLTFVSRDGLYFRKAPNLDASSSPMAHNLAILGDQNEYVLIGGMQDWNMPALWDRWLTTSSQWHSSWMLPTPQENPASGIHMWRGSGWPPAAGERNWSLPKIVIHGSRPSNCIDRRPSRTGNLGCEFDGRLSLVRLRRPGLPFRLYSRANLREHSPVGGRAVQTSISHDLHTWSSWQPVRLARLPADTVDIYFFLVQRNPVDPEGSLLALFPVSQPPNACIAVAFSAATDGVNFSQPVNLLNVKLGWRTADEHGRGPVEWRATAHPSAGVFLRAESVYIYVHHAVVGTDMEDAAGNPTRLERYIMPRSELEALTPQFSVSQLTV